MICCNCKAVFDRPAILSEIGEAWGSTYSEDYKACPYCHSTDIVNTDRYHICECCGEPCCYDYIETKDDRYYCENCYTSKNIDD